MLFDFFSRGGGGAYFIKFNVCLFFISGKCLVLSRGKKSFNMKGKKTTFMCLFENWVRT